MRTISAALVLSGFIGGSALFSPAVRSAGTIHSSTVGAWSFAATRRTRANALSMATSSPRRPGGDRPDEPSSRMESTVKNMLLEASISSVVYYWLEFRDDLSPKWLTSFTKANGEIGEIGWRRFLTNLMRTEPEELVVRRISQRPLGGSGNNPYLSSNRAAMEYNVLIEPITMAKKIMQVREQMSLEWKKDMGLMEAENSELTRFREDSMGVVKEKAEHMHHVVFEDDPFAPVGTPQRGKNYKKLLDLVTKVGIRNYRAELRVSGDRYTLNWLERFMTKNDMEGSKKLKGNALVEAILDGPIVMIKDPRTDKPRMIDPSKIAREIMGFRHKEARAIVMMMDDIPMDHSTLNRVYLEERLKDGMADGVISERRRRIVEASGPENPFPTRDSVQGEGGDLGGDFEA
ncbi:unnamed protein product [Discosporangium mesarthrocarpum]